MDKHEQDRIDIARVVGTLDCLSSMKGAVVTETMAFTLVNCIDLLELVSAHLAKDVPPDEGFFEEADQDPPTAAH